MEAHGNDQVSPEAVQPRVEASIFQKGKLIVELALLPPGALLDECAMAEVFSVTKRTIRRMVTKREVPPPICLAGRATWVAGSVVQHITDRVDDAAKRASREARRLDAVGFQRPTNR